MKITDDPMYKRAAELLATVELRNTIAMVILPELMKRELTISRENEELQASYRVAAEQWQKLELQYSERLGELARLCSIVCPFLRKLLETPMFDEPEVFDALNSLELYVEEVRP